MGEVHFHILGGAGSGNFGHKGRPGAVGGSVGGKGGGGGEGGIREKESKSQSEIDKVVVGFEKGRASSSDHVIALGEAWQKDNKDLFDRLKQETAQYKRNEICEEVITKLKEGQPGKNGEIKLYNMSKTSADNMKKTISEINQLTGQDINTLSQISIEKGIRNYANKMTREIVLSGFNRSSLFHEVGHHVEFSNDKINLLTREYRNSRIIDNKGSRLLSDIISKSRYNETEKGYNTNIINKYAGKTYKDGSTEIISIGLSYFSMGSKLGALISKDIKTFYFVVGVFQAQKRGVL